MPRAVRTVDPLSVGSGARLRELYKIPRWVAIGWLFLRGAFRHYLTTLSIIVVFYLWYLWGFDNFIWAVLAVVLFWVGLISIVWWYKGGDLKTGWRYFTLMKKWRHTVAGVGLKSRDGQHIPRYSRVRPVKGGLKFRVDMAVAARGVNDLRAEADDIAEVIGAYRVQVFSLWPGMAEMVLLWTKETIVAIDDRPVDTTTYDADGIPDIGDYTKLIFGKTGSGLAIISLLVSVFIAGVSRSGKSNIVRAIFHALIKQNIPHELYVIDPAGGVELGELEHYPKTLAYVDMPSDAGDAIKKAHADMRARFAAMKRLGLNKVSPSTEFPLRLIVIDELLLLPKDVQEVPGGELTEILAVGAKACFVVIVLSQLSQVDAVGRIRGMFPQKICLATDSPEMTEACLGKGAEVKGAKCSELVIPRDQGTGYYKNVEDDSKGFTRFRAFECGGSLLTGVDGVDRKSKNANRRCARYRYYDITGRALYIGIGFQPEVRAKRHAVNSLWWVQVDHTRTKIDWYRNEEEARVAEREAIREENPVHNTQGRKLDSEV